MNKKYEGLEEMLDCKGIYKRIMAPDNKLQAIVVKPEEESLIRILSQYAGGWEKVILLCANNKDAIPVQIIPVMYANDPKNTADLSHARAGAVYEMFTRWEQAGFNRYHAKNIFGCKAFMAFLDHIGYLKADYIVFKV